MRNGRCWCWNACRYDRDGNSTRDFNVLHRNPSRDNKIESLLFQRDSKQEPQELRFIVDSSTQHGIVSYDRSSQTYLEAYTVECQTETTMQPAQIQTDEKQVADTEVQTVKTKTVNLALQVKTKTKSSVTQTRTHLIDAGVGAHVELEDQGTQPEISMFRLEDMKPNDDFIVRSLMSSLGLNVIYL